MGDGALRNRWPRRVSHCLEDRDAARIPGSRVLGGGNYSACRVSGYMILDYLQCPSLRQRP
jgi:hypothetical protein